MPLGRQSIPGKRAKPFQNPENKARSTTSLLGEIDRESAGAGWDQQAVDAKLRSLSHEKQALSGQLEKGQRALSHATLKEHACQQRVEKYQTRVDYHRSHVANVNKQISQLSAELKSRERAAWDAHQAERERRLRNSRARGKIEEDRDERRYGGMGSAINSRKGQPAASLSMPSLESSANARSEPAVSSQSIAPRSAPYGSRAARPSQESNSSFGDESSVTGARSTDDDEQTAQMALAEEEVAMSQTLARMVSAPGPRRSLVVQSTKPSKRASVFCESRFSTPAEKCSSPANTGSASATEKAIIADPIDASMPAARDQSTETFPEGATLLDWFDEQDKALEGKARPSMSPESFGPIPLGPQESGQDQTPDMTRVDRARISSIRQERTRINRLKDDLRREEEAEEARRRAVFQHHAAVLDQRSSMVSAVAERKLVLERRAEVRCALEESAGGAREAYSALDQNGSGRISMNEFEGGIRALGVKWEVLTGFTKIRDLFKLFDQDKRGYLVFSDMFPLDARSEEDPNRMSTPEFWRYWCRKNQDVSPSVSRSALWEPSGPEESLEILRKTREYREHADEKKKWMRGVIHRLKSQGKGDARCREVVALHLPKGSGPKDLEDVKTFSQSDVHACKKAYQDDVQETVRSIEKTVSAMHDQRKTLHHAKQQLWHTTEEPFIRARAVEESSKQLQSLGGLGGLFKKHHEEPPDTVLGGLGGLFKKHHDEPD